MLPIIINLTFTDPADETRFRYLIGNYWDAMVRIAEKILKNRADAEDAAQNAFIRLYLCFDRYKGYSTKGQVALLYRMVKNSAIDIYRENESKSKSEISFDSGLDVLSSSESKDRGLIEAMEKLTADDRDLIVLRYYYEYSIKELAKHYGIAVKSVYKRLERAKERLDKALKEAESE